MSNIKGSADSRSSVNSVEPVGCCNSYKYKKCCRLMNPYWLVYWDGVKSSQFQEYKTKKEIDKVVKDILSGKPLLLIPELKSKSPKVYPVRFLTMKQIGVDYRVKKS